MKTTHELRDPVHVFINYNEYERDIINSEPVQRLRNIHQLAMSYLVYPGATHRRFEHSLGVMELASRVYAVVTRQDQDHLNDEIRSLLPEVTDPDTVRYWKRALRMAALCHDLGHLPFSHAAERELLPEGWDHERISRALIESMTELWQAQSGGPLNTEHIVKLALGPKKVKDLTFSRWETILSEIIVGDAFGADRMDYLLRDAHHAGTPNGRFDHYRLVDTLRLLPNDVGEPALGIESGGLGSAEALLLARYFMYSQVYFHHVRAIYDIHLIDFLKAWLDGGRFNPESPDHFDLTDNAVLEAIREAARSEQIDGHDAARRIIERDHYRVLYQRMRRDAEVVPGVTKVVFDATIKEFGEHQVRMTDKLDTNKTIDFPVRHREGISQAQAMSEVLNTLPVVAAGYVYVSPEIRAEASKWLDQHREEIIRPPGGEGHDGQN